MELAAPRSCCKWLTEMPGKSNSYRPLGKSQYFWCQAMSRLLVLSHQPGNA